MKMKTIILRSWESNILENIEIRVLKNCTLTALLNTKTECKLKK